MCNKLAIVFSVALTSIASTASASFLSMDFTNFNFTPITGTNNVGGILNEQYRATNVINLPGAGQVDAIFEFVATSHDDEARISFVDEQPARGDDARIRIDKNGLSSDIWVQVDLTFESSIHGSNFDVAAYTANTSDLLRVQFDDLDSDAGQNRADFAGMLTSQIISTQLDPTSDIISDTALITDYTVGRYPGPSFTADPNVSSLDPADQAKVAIGFDTTAATISFVAGVTGGQATGNRHIDLDMTPDFIIPEPASLALLGLGSLMMLKRRQH